MPAQRISTVHVVGSMNRDVVVLVDRHAQPGETVVGSSLTLLPGGKGLNQAVAAARAGAAVSFVGAVGSDPDGADLVATLVAAGVDVSGVAVVAAPTGTALVTVDASGESVIVVVAGANHLVVPAAAAALVVVSGDVVLTQLEVPREVVAAAMGAARAAGALSVLNAAPALALPDEVLEMVDVAVVNETELEMFGGMARLLARLAPHGRVIATLGPAGAVVADRSGEVVVEGRLVGVVDSTGAGDCFVGVAAARLAAGSSLIDAARAGNAAASLAVQRHGAAGSMPTSAEIEALLA